ncbi:DNA topoisomerase [Rhodoblastus sphagnicola]|uniref:DNA topoisomerase n=1 Tax=Rhodoblastus sphagnicola TaxID=333368 RepID=UPI001FEFC6AE|nr:DNA topoisomerase [Rhodoblastus sphagnicola]
MQKLCGSRFGWSAAKTLELAQELYDGQGKKIITYPRAEVRYLPGLSARMTSQARKRCRMIPSASMSRKTISTPTGWPTAQAASSPTTNVGTRRRSNGWGKRLSSASSLNRPALAIGRWSARWAKAIDVRNPTLTVEIAGNHRKLGHDQQ